MGLVTGDVHFPFCVSYDPWKTGQPAFYELGVGPLSSVPLSTAEPLPTFNPRVVFAEGHFASTFHNFGHITVAPSGQLRFRVIDRDNRERFALSLDPSGAATSSSAAGGSAGPAGAASPSGKTSAAT